MKDLSRREFLRWAQESILDQIALPKILVELKKKNVETEWLDAGRLADLIPGLSKTITLGENIFVLSSDSEGVRAFSEASQSYMTLRSLAGRLEISSKNKWPKYRKLSHVTGCSVDEIAERQQDDGDLRRKK